MVTRETFMSEKIKTIMKTGDRLINEKRMHRTDVDMSIYYKCEEIREQLKNGTIKDFESAICRRIFKMLVIDDHRDVAQMIAIQLQNAGFPHVDIVFSGEDAISIINRKTYDLVICDYKLGDMTGNKVFFEMQQLAHIPSFILMSGYSSQQIQILKDCGILVLPKPFNFEKLRVFVEAVYLKRLKVLVESTKSIIDLLGTESELLSSLDEGYSE